MTRRRFFSSLLALISSPLLGKLAVLVPGGEAVLQGGTIYFRELVKKELARWISDELDRRVIEWMMSVRQRELF